MGGAGVASTNSCAHASPSLLKDVYSKAAEVSLTPGAENWLGARLLDQRGRMLVGALLSFTVDGNALGTGWTDNHGFVWIPFYPGAPHTRTLTVAFSGAEGFAGASDTVQLATASQATPLHQYAIIVAITAATFGIVTVLVLHRRRMSEDVAHTLGEAVGESKTTY